MGVMSSTHVRHGGNSAGGYCGVCQHSKQPLFGPLPWLLSDGSCNFRPPMAARTLPESAASVATLLQG
ncbi:unnamed protein product [Sphagnum troendelagicum]